MTNKTETYLHGIAASPGIVFGKAYVFTKHIPRIEERTIKQDDVGAELERLEHALKRSENELEKVLKLTEEKIGNQKAKIFEAQIMILADAVLFDAVKKRIKKELKNAEWIVHKEISRYQEMMLKSPDEYMRERSHDVEDVKNRLIRNIQQERLISRFEKKTIVISELLTPADTMLFSRNDVLAYATDMGGITSHAALLSRSLKIPSVVGLKELTKKVQTGDWVLLDGYGGNVIINPSRETVLRFNKRKREHKQFEEKLELIRDFSAVTTDGKEVQLSGNIEFSQEFRYLQHQGAHGIGLHRTEGLFLRSQGYPTEQVQFQEYKTIVEKSKPYKVVMRVFDIGGDKVVADMREEDNPFLGWRGIRILLDKPDLFTVQLRAILRASAFGEAWIMLPMVSGIKEIRQAKELIENAKNELRTSKIPFDENIKVGVMIEVPSAAVIASDIAQEVDFLSIGTNDLIQYLIAVDRGNEVVSSLYQEFHPAVIKTIHHIIKSGHAHNKQVSMCGEMAGDPIATLLLLGLGLDEFSVAPIVLPEIKKIIRSVSFKETEEIANHVLQMKTEEDIRDFLRVNLHSMVPELLLE